ncbi:alpha-L-fucosidase [Gleimia sp. 6138-11-ORH1]|uniref:alpha-L-fucosidase n=1 Tax=Gleimia sp. 6138-11-ORH1 TaxID=2973937 RepID=UPI0021672352|nr:alpha-L-fucosidase [Gleimia sp. 6138-11-ORH1]MCS4484302.1 alpha-L-fucosidase [Gleimia sp. 6138-11-ORH1]
MVNFETRIGPPDLIPQTSYPKTQTPQWFLDAKLGFFIHYGLYSIPAWAYQPQGETIPLEDAYTYHQYAEWYANTYRIENSPCRKFHEASFGVGTSYEDFADRFTPQADKLTETVKLLVAAGAKYLVPTAKHHDGFCLWDTQTTDFNSAKRGAKLDVIDLITKLTREAGVKVGIYFSGALDWHCADFPPIQSDREIFTYRRNDPAFARYAAAQLTELIDRFKPELLWNDIDWPDAGKSNTKYSLSQLLKTFFTKTPEGIVNDRWGIPYHGYLTREYTHVANIIEKPWEATRGLGKSFGVNHHEADTDFLTLKGLLLYFTDVVSKGGNLLLNVGPNADGSLEPRQATLIRGLGKWMERYGKFIYGSRPWIRHLAEPACIPSPTDERYLLLPATHPAAGLAVVIRDRTASHFLVPLDFPETTGYWYWEGNTYPIPITPGQEVKLPPANSNLPIILHLPNHQA